MLFVSFNFLLYSYDGSANGRLKNHIERPDQNNKRKSTSDPAYANRASGVDTKQRPSLKSESNRVDQKSSHASRSSHHQQKMADLNLARGHSPHFSPSRSNAPCDVQTLHVHLPNHGFRMIRFDEASDVRQIINLIVGSMSPGQKTNPQSYALRLRHILTKEVSISFD